MGSETQLSTLIFFFFCVMFNLRVKGILLQLVYWLLSWFELSFWVEHDVTPDVGLSVRWS